MQTLQNGYRGLRVLMMLNWDRALALLTLIAALMLAAYVGTP